MSMRDSFPNWLGLLIGFGGALVIMVACALAVGITIGVVRWVSNQEAGLSQDPISEPNLESSSEAVDTPMEAEAINTSTEAEAEAPSPQQAALKDGREFGEVQSGADGASLAVQVEQLDDRGELEVVFIGRVAGVEPWMVNGIPLVINAETMIDGDIGVGDLVRVEIKILSGGMWQVSKITLISDGELGVGCLDVSTVVVKVNANQVELLSWPAIILTDQTAVIGEITQDSVILFRVCFNNDATATITNVRVIYQLNPVEITDPTPLPPPPP